MKKNIFISKNEAEIQPFVDDFKGENVGIITHSFLSFHSVDFEVKSPYEILFFSSPRSVIFFKNQYSIPQHVKIACVGLKTQQLLEEMAHVVSYTRTAQQSLSEFATSFKEWCGDQRVLFPISSISLKTISSRFPVEQIEEVEVYSTEIKGKKIANCSIYVFTSPSNVKGFLEKNTFPENVTVISWGESTSKLLLEKGIKIDIELKTASLKELFELLNKLV